MMARSHALSGAVCWLLIAPRIAPGLPTVVVAGGALVGAGAALLPDIDHPDSKVTSTLGPPGALVSGVVAGLTGGHRKGTHSLLFAILCTGLCWLAVTKWPTNAVTVIAVALAALGCAAIRDRQVWVLAGSAAVAGWTIWDPTAAALAGPALVWSIAIGCVAHLVGDSLTPGGVPWLWPWEKRWAIPVLPSTGGIAETLLATVPLAGLCAWLAWQHIGPFTTTAAGG